MFSLDSFYFSVTGPETSEKSKSILDREWIQEIGDDELKSVGDAI